MHGRYNGRPKQEKINSGWKVEGGFAGGKAGRSKVVTGNLKNCY